MTFCGGLTAKSNDELLHALKASHPKNLHARSSCFNHRAFHSVLRLSSGLFCRRLLKQAGADVQHGRRSRHVRRVCVRAAWNFGGLGDWNRVSSIWVRRQGPTGFLIAQGWSLLIVCGLAGLLAGVPYLLSDKPPTVDGKRVELQFELRAPATFTIPDQPDGHSIRVSLYADNRQDEYAFIDWSGIIKDPEHATIPGHVPLLTHSKTRSLLASIGNEPVASQFIELRIPPKPRKDDEAWSDWIFATQRADLSPVSESERMAIRYRVRPVND